jgi:hypothetical protein
MSDSVHFTLECSKVDECHVYFEPEGADVVVTSDDKLTVEIRGGDSDGQVEITYVPNGIVVWARAGAETLVWDSSGRRVSV